MAHGRIHNLGKNFSGAGQWRVGGDKEQKKQRLGNNLATYLPSTAQCQGGARVTETEFCPMDPMWQASGTDMGSKQQVRLKSRWQ